MTSVFASFILNGDPTIKQFGVGLAGAVLLAGILVITLAPAAITLMGEAAWWLPRWLDRLLPTCTRRRGGDPESEAAPAPEARPPPSYHSSAGSADTGGACGTAAASRPRARTRH
jgi:hypothetical protein